MHCFSHLPAIFMWTTHPAMIAAKLLASFSNCFFIEHPPLVLLQFQLVCYIHVDNPPSNWLQSFLQAFQDASSMSILLWCSCSFNFVPSGIKYVPPADVGCHAHCCQELGYDCYLCNLLFQVLLWKQTTKIAHFDVLSTVNGCFFAFSCQSQACPYPKNCPRAFSSSFAYRPLLYVQ
jgi:hypothetical protein